MTVRGFPSRLIRDAARGELRVLSVPDATLSAVSDPSCVHDTPMTTARAGRHCGAPETPK